MNPKAMREMAHDPGFERWWKSIHGVTHAWGGGRDLASGAAMPEPRAHDLIEYMDEFDVDVCFALRESMTGVNGNTFPMSTHASMMEIEPYPDRMCLECNVGPILERGVKNAIWGLE